MSLINCYATLQNFLDYRSTTDTDAVDDGIIESLLKSTSLYIDMYTGRTFYPRVETRYFDIPEGRVFLDDDLLEVVSLKHGDSDTVSSSDYILDSVNYTPYWGLHLRDSSSISWETNADSSAEQAIILNGWWGYHDKYSQRAWASGGTLSAAIATTTATTFTMNNNHTILAGQIVKIDSEIMNVASVGSSDTITPVSRGDNGSTAATHLISSIVYIWQPMYDISQACLEIAASAYRRRKGQYVTGAAQVTAAGVVITPQDVPGQAREILDKYKRVR